MLTQFSCFCAYLFRASSFGVTAVRGTFHRTKGEMPMHDRRMAWKLCRAVRRVSNKGADHGGNSGQISGPDGAEEGVRGAGNHHGGRLSAGDAGVVRLQG